jgi:hypothetical protein
MMLFSNSRSDFQVIESPLLSLILAWVENFQIIVMRLLPEKFSGCGKPLSHAPFLFIGSTLIFVATFEEFGIWNLEFGIRNLEFGIRNLARVYPLAESKGLVTFSMGGLLLPYCTSHVSKDL